MLTQRRTSQRPPERTPRGFTLIELLVVVSIIALLISILLPSLGSARGLARSVQCLSVMKQFGIADGVYGAENSGWHIPIKSRHGDNPNYKPGHGHDYLTFWNIPSVRTSLGVPGRPADENKVGAWYKDWKIICPDATAAIGFDHDIRDAYALNALQWETGAAGGKNLAWGPPSSHWFVWRDSEIVSPSEKLQMTEANYFAIREPNFKRSTLDPAQGWDLYGDQRHQTGTVPLYMRYPHPNKSANAQFFDGHARSMPSTGFYPGKLDYRMWTPNTNARSAPVNPF